MCQCGPASLSLRRLCVLLPAPRLQPHRQSGLDSPSTTAGSSAGPGPARNAPPAPGASDSGAGLSFRQEKRSCLSAVCAQGFFFAGVCGLRRGPSTGVDGPQAAQTPGGHVCRALRPPVSASPELGLEGWAAGHPWHSLGLGLLVSIVTPQRTSPASGTWALSALRAEGAREHGGHICKGQKPGG